MCCWLVLAGYLQPKSIESSLIKATFQIEFTNSATSFLPLFTLFVIELPIRALSCQGALSHFRKFFICVITTLDCVFGRTACVIYFSLG
jgi:hypothetical protein